MSIKIEDVEVVGWQKAIKGARNALESYHRSDSIFYDHVDLKNREIQWHDIMGCYNGTSPIEFTDGEDILDAMSAATHYKHHFGIGKNDYDLMMKLAKAGTSHSKYRRFIICYVDIIAPLYMLKELDTYRHGVEKNSCSTMHRIHSKEITLDDFSTEHLLDRYGDPSMNVNYGQKYPLAILQDTIYALNRFREEFLATNDKLYWWQIIQLLPSSYNQKRTYMFSYEALAKIYSERKDHKLDEWRKLCEWIETLPYSEIITLKEPKETPT